MASVRRWARNDADHRTDIRESAESDDASAKERKGGCTPKTAGNLLEVSRIGHGDVPEGSGLDAMSWWQLAIGDDRARGEAATQWHGLPRAERYRVGARVKAALRSTNRATRTHGARVAETLTLAGWDELGLTEHLALEVAAVFHLGRPLETSAPVPGCACAPCTGLPQDHPARRVRTPKDVRPAVNLDRARAVDVVEVARRLGCGEPVRRGRELHIRCPLHADAEPSLFELDDHHVRLLTLAAEAWDRCAQARFALDKSGTIEEFRWWGADGSNATTAIRFFADNGSGAPRTDPFFEVLNPFVLSSAATDVVPRGPAVFENRALRCCPSLSNQARFSGSRPWYR